MAAVVEFGEVPQNTKTVIVGVDFGHAYSGVAFAFRAIPGNIICCAPTATDCTMTKVPTSLLQLPNGEWKFGCEAESEYSSRIESGVLEGVHLYKRFKMMLKGQTTGLDRLEALSHDGKRYNLLELIKTSLEFLKNYALDRISVGFGEVKLSDFHWVLTVPCIWNNAGNSFMRRAAYLAGMIEHEESDNLTIKLEPEAAALAVHLGAFDLHILSTGTRFMVVDAGGGTVDITTHEVASVNPLALETLAMPSGGDWGAENVDAEFKTFLLKLLENSNLGSSEYSYEHFQIMQEFSKVKRMFSGEQEPQTIRLMDVLERKSDLVRLAETHNSKNPHIPIDVRPSLRNGYLTMSRQLMLSFFEPTLQRIVAEVRRVLKEVRDVQYIIMVGGYSANKVLLNRIRDEFHMKGNIRVVMPDPNPKPQSAIVYGAVVFGMYARVLQPPIANHDFALMVSTGIHSIVQRGQPLNINQRVTIRAAAVNVDDEDVLVEIVRDGSDVILQLVVPCPPNATGAHELAMTVQFKALQVRVSVHNGAGEMFQQSVIVKDLRQGRVPGALRVLAPPVDR